MEIEELASRVTPEGFRLGENDLAAFESNLPASLPYDLRRFLVLSGGGGPIDEPLEYKWQAQGSMGPFEQSYWVEFFCKPDGNDDYHSIRPLYRHIEDMGHTCANVPREIYVIADDWGGNFLTVDLRSGSHGEIGLVDHETVGDRFGDDETYQIIARSFGAFVAGLEPE